MSLSPAIKPVQISSSEKNQLGSIRLKKDDTPSAHPYPSAEQWPRIRAMLLQRSKASNPRLDETLTAYTPGETVDLLLHPDIQAWHRSCTATLSREYTVIALVPCAKTKPWTGPSVARSKLYSAYNQLRDEMPHVCFTTISEPLGIVPMQNWADFPQYDNPGLFRDDAQRSGMTTKQWAASEFGQHLGLPFDESAYDYCVGHLGSVVGRFLSNHGDRKVVSFVDNAAGAKSTHSDMLDAAMEMSGVAVERRAKRAKPRVSPLSYLREQIESLSNTETPKDALPSLRD